MRIEPSLPIIAGGSFYQFEVFIDCFDSSDFILKIIFFDKNEEEIEAIMLREKKEIIKCPIKSYSYIVQLINIGTANFCFHSIVIREIGDKCEE